MWPGRTGWGGRSFASAGTVCLAGAAVALRGSGSIDRRIDLESAAEAEQKHASKQFGLPAGCFVGMRS
jgi:hypothetical protein